MAWLLENFDLEGINESEETLQGLLKYIIAEGKIRQGYSGINYFNKRLGFAQFIVHVIADEEHKYMVNNMDTHASGNCVWNVLIQSDITPEDASKGEKRLMLKSAKDGKGLVVSNIVNADILPSFLEDDSIKLQMIAFPESMDIFEDEDDYADSVEETFNDKKLLLSDGMIFPNGFLINHDANSEECEKNSWMDEYVLICATIKSIHWGNIQIEDKIEDHAYLETVVGTQFGDIEVIHTISQIKEEQRKKFKVGAKVFGLFILSGDPAVNEYVDGCVYDEEHDLALLRYMFQTGNAKRIYNALSDDVHFVTAATKKKFIGKEEVIERFNYVFENMNKKCFAHLATISSVDDYVQKPAYNKGKRCIVISYNNWDSYTSICFIETNEQGKITKIEIVEDENYHFKIDEYPSFEDDDEE